MSLEVPALTTELSAVNLMLEAIQTAPISSFADPVPAEIVSARNILEKVSVAMQSKGWHFNTEHDFPLTPDLIDGFITVGLNIVRVDLDDAVYGGDFDIVQRGQRLYDRKNRTFVFTKELKGEVVILLAFTELPESARAYIALRAARKFQQSLVGDTELDGFSQTDEFNAWTDLMDFEGATRDHSIFNNFDVFRAIDRTNIN